MKTVRRMVLSFSINLTASQATFMPLLYTRTNVTKSFSTNNLFARLWISSKPICTLLKTLFLRYLTISVCLMDSSKIKFIWLSSDNSPSSDSFCFYMICPFYWFLASYFMIGTYYYSTSICPFLLLPSLF